VRESLFAKLEALGAVSDSRVLDLYAGTGALALEAASRGAQSVTMVEHNAAAAKVARENTQLVSRALANAGVSLDAVVVQKSVQQFLSGQGAGKEFDLVLIDPPYELNNSELEREFAQLQKWLAPQAIIVLERSSKSPAPNAEAFELFDARKYGDTQVYFYRWDS
jgi:16S rRNA (guanine966-N2)-methyltransferase